MKKCIIMRGAPGSGKDWWINHNIPGGPCVISADSYFMSDGVYRFDRGLLSEAHDSCLCKFLDAAQNEDPLIVVSNTNTKVFEIAPYYRIAEALGYDVEIIWMIAYPETCMARNQHDVPENVIRSMIVGVEPLPSWWNVRIVLNNDMIKD